VNCTSFPRRAVEHDVGWLEIPVQDARVMRRRQPGAQLPGDPDCFVSGQPADAAQERGEVFPVDVLHRQELLSAEFADVEDPADLRVRHLARHANSLWKRAKAAPSLISPDGRNLSATG
jgi:hypothetical protein